MRMLVRRGRWLTVTRHARTRDNLVMDNLSYSEPVVIGSQPVTAYEMIADITRMGEWSRVCKKCWWDDDASQGAGSWFTGRNEMASGPGKRARRWLRRTKATSPPSSSVATDPLGLPLRSGRRWHQGHRVLGVPPGQRLGLQGAPRGQRRGRDGPAMRATTALPSRRHRLRSRGGGSILRCAPNAGWSRPSPARRASPRPGRRASSPRCPLSGR